MTDSRANRAVFALAIALTAGLVMPVAGQNSLELETDTSLQLSQAGGAPVRLGPRREVSPVPVIPKPKPDMATNAPEPLRPIAPGLAPPNTVTLPRSAPVDVQLLRAVDNDSVGVIDDSEGGLGVDMWGTTDRALVVQSLALLPRNAASPVMRNLMRRLLLTRATAPPRKARGPSLLSLRIGALFDIGDLDSAMALIGRAPFSTTEEQLLLTEVESRFFQQDTSGACGKVRAAAEEYKAVYWQQAMAYCLALAGNTAEAALMSDIIEERSASVHPAFFAAMETLSGSPPTEIASLSEPSALYLSMLRTAAIKLPPDVKDKASAAVTRAIALSPNAPLDLRLSAAENAAERGILEGSVLADIYSAVPFEASVLASPLQQAEAEWGSRGRALLVRAARQQTVPAARAEVLQAAIRIAQKRGGLRVLAAASLPMLMAMKPTPELAWFAGTAARTLILVGEFSRARLWVELDLRNSQESTGVAATPQSIFPLAILIGADGSSQPNAQALQAWWQRENSDNAAEKLAAARVFFSLLDSFDVPVPSSLWAPILGAPPVENLRSPGPGIQSALRRAVSAGNRGETVALSLIALGDTGPEPNNMLAVNLAVRALRTIGLTMEAQRIALEAAVAAGL